MHQFLKNLLFFSVVIIIAMGCFLAFNDLFIFGVLLFSIFLFIIYKKRLNTLPLVIILLWGVINLFSYNINQTSFSLYTFLGYIVKLLIPYFTIKVIGVTIFQKFSKVVYVLSIISFPFYLFQLFAPEILELLNPILEPVTAEAYKGEGWYGFIFTYSRLHLRNSGFMWEPGAFAMAINLAILEIWSRNNFKISKQIIVLIIALLTTLSTMAYISLAIFSIIFLLSIRKPIWLLLVLPIIIFSSVKVWQLEFMDQKLRHYIDNIDQQYYSESIDALKVNRFGMFKISLEEVIDQPIGYGVVPSRSMIDIYDEKIEGVGGLSNILLMWGFFGLIFVFFSFYKFLKMKWQNKNLLIVFLGSLVLTATFFSNPGAKNPLLILLIYYPYIFKLNRVLPNKGLYMK